MASVESYLTRELDLRFIDARNLATEARRNLGIVGYPSRSQARQVRQEALHIYHSKTLSERRSLQQMNLALVNIKGDTQSTAGCSETDSSDGDSSHLRRRSSGFGIFRRDSRS